VKSDPIAIGLKNVKSDPIAIGLKSEMIAIGLKMWPVIDGVY
jgi:hypothetical protein